MGDSGGRKGADAVIRRGSLVLEIGSKVPLTTPSRKENQISSPHTPIENQLDLLPVSEGRPQKSCRVLVANGSRQMAREITYQLVRHLPGCSLMFAPTVELSCLILKRHKIDLVVSSPRLPDGRVNRLQSELQKLATPPDLVVVGRVSADGVSALGEAGYSFMRWKRLGERGSFQQSAREQRADPFQQAGETRSPVKSVQNRVQTLGADIRNDLNNPLQEIVAMVFVAQQAAEMAPTTHQALTAIDAAAKNMAECVSRLEERIRKVVV